MKKLLFLQILLLVIIFSCNKEILHKQNQIVVSMGSEPNTIDPTLNDMGAVSTYIIHSFESLTKIDSNNNIKPGISESWSISDDKLTYTFYLRTNAKWSDKKPVTAYDFQYSWRRAVDTNVKAPYSYIMDIIKNAKKINLGLIDKTNLAIKVIDDYVLEVTLENPESYFLELIAFTSIFAPLREDIINKYGNEWTLKPETYICNGQYKMAKINRGKEIIYEENPYYYDKNEIVAKKIKFVSTSDVNFVINDIKNDKMHFSAIDLPNDDIEILQNNGYIILNNCIGTYYLELNITNNFLKDKRVRQALSLAIDRNYLVEKIVKPKAVAAGAFVPPVVKGIEKSFREESSNFINIYEYEKNILKARKLMQEAGYPNGKNFPILVLNVSYGTFHNIGVAIQQMWKNALNIYIKLKLEEFPNTLISLNKKDYQMARMGWTGDYYDPMTMLDIMISHSRVNHSSFSNEKYDALIYEAKSSKNNNLRMNNMREAESILLDEMPIIPLYYKTDSLIVNPKLKNVIITALGRYKFNYCYIEE